MKKILTLLLVVSLMITLFSGCAGQRKGIDEARHLSGEEKAELVRIALSMDEVKATLENREDYHIRLGWALIKWQEENPEALDIGYYDYDYEEFSERFEQDIANGAEIYSAVMIQMGDPIDYGVNVSINPDTLQIVSIIRTPLTPVNYE